MITMTSQKLGDSVQTAHILHIAMCSLAAIADPWDPQLEFAMIMMQALLMRTDQG